MSLRRNPTFRTSLAEMNVTYRKSKSRSEISRKVVRICFPGVFASCLAVTLTYAEMSMETSRFLRAHGHGHGRTRASSGGEGRHGERRGGAKRIARGLKTRKRPQMMVMMARVAFRALKTKNGAAIAVRDGGHDIGRTNPTSWASARASTASGSHRRRTWTSTRPW